MARLERVKGGLDALDIRLAVLAVDRVELVLERLRLGLGRVGEAVAGARVAAEVTQVELDLLRDKVVLATLHLVELLAVDDDAGAGATAATATATARELDASLGGVGLCGRVEEALGLSLAAEALGWLLRESDEEDAVGASRTETPGLGEVRLDARETEATRHLAADHASDEAARVLAERARVALVERGTKLRKRQLLALLWRRAELGLEVAEDLVLERRLAADEVLDRL